MCTPRYVAFITDGNRRWAEHRRLSTAAGHAAAADTLAARIADALEFGIRELSVFTFSTENWIRPALELDALMEMFARRIPIEASVLHRQGIRMRFIGQRDGLSPQLLDRIDRAHSLTDANRRMTLFLAFNYGAKAEIVQAAARFDGHTEAEFRQCLYAPEMHDPELVIRTSGEQRLSNFLLWQSAYSQLVFRDECWPDFTRQAFQESLAEFDVRHSRLGQS